MKNLLFLHLLCNCFHYFKLVYSKLNTPCIKPYYYNDNDPSVFRTLKFPLLSLTFNTLCKRLSNEGNPLPTVVLISANILKVAELKIQLILNCGSDHWARHSVILKKNGNLTMTWKISHLEHPAWCVLRPCPCGGSENSEQHDIMT